MQRSPHSVFLTNIRPIVDYLLVNVSVPGLGYAGPSPSASRYEESVMVGHAICLLGFYRV